jgi:hypothetical protein
MGWARWKGWAGKKGTRGQRQRQTATGNGRRAASTATASQNTIRDTTATTVLGAILTNAPNSIRTLHRDRVRAAPRLYIRLHLPPSPHPHTRCDLSPCDCKAYWGQARPVGMSTLLSVGMLPRASQQPPALSSTFLASTFLELPPSKLCLRVQPVHTAAAERVRLPCSKIRSRNCTAPRTALPHVQAPRSLPSSLPAFPHLPLCVQHTLHHCRSRR